MAKALTVKAVDAERPGAVRREVPDRLSQGLYLVIQPSGAKSWAFRYRSPIDGRPKKVTLDRYPGMSLAEARTGAGDYAADVRHGIDPGEKKKAAKARKADTSDIVDTLLDQFVARHIEPNTRASTAAIAKRAIETIIRPAWGRRKIDTITRRDVIALLDPIAKRAPVNANRVHSLVRKFLNFCVNDRAMLEISPMLGLKAPSVETTRDRVLSDDELRLLWQATAGGAPFDRCMRLLLLTGQRRMEVGGMRYSELRLAENDPVWTLPSERTKNGREHAVPLTAAAIEALTGIPRIKESDLVFTTDGKVPSSGWSKSKRLLDARMHAAAQQQAEEQGREPPQARSRWTIHDVRRTVASGMARLQQPPHVIEATLNHMSGTVSGVSAVYNRYRYADEKRIALEAWAAHLKQIV